MRTTRRPAIITAITIVGLSTLLAACGGEESRGDETDPTQGVEGRPGLCANLQLLGKSLDRVRNLEPSTTLSEAEDVRKEVDFALSELSEAESNVPTRQIAQLQASFEDFDAEIDSVASGNASGSQPLGDKAASLRARAAGLSEVHASVSREAACP